MSTREATLRCMSAACAVVVVLAAPVPAGAETAADVIAQAFKASEAATHRRVQLKYRISDSAFSQVTTRVLPDRFHSMTSRPGKPDLEHFAIGQQLFTKVANTWRVEPLPVRMQLDASAIDMFMPHFARLREGASQTINGRPHRLFAGTIGWQTGRDRNEGVLQLLIDTRNGLPTSASFEGRCGPVECSFSQSFSFDRSMKVEAPR